MKLFNKLAPISASIALIACVALGSGIASADGLGQVEGGSSNYTIANLTKGSGFSNTQSADACDTLEYRLHLYNPGPDSISAVNVEATINDITPYTQYVSTATAFAPDSLTPQVNFQATLNLSSSQTQSYVKGSTVLLNSAGSVISSSANGGLTDTITTGAGGVSVGSLGASVDEYLEFKTEVGCPVVTTPPTCNSVTANAQSADVESIAYSANSATVSGYNLNLYSGSNTSVTPLASSGNLGLNGLPYQFSTSSLPAGNSYTVVATVLTNMGNVTSSGCKFTFTTPPKTPPTTPPVTPPTTPPVSTLPNTGPGTGGLVAIFGGTSVAGSGAYYWFTKRRLSR